MPEGLRRTLAATFEAIEHGQRDSEGRAPTDPGVLGLQNTMRGACADVEQALDRVPSSFVNLYRLVHDRVVALAPSLWDEVLWIRWSWITTSMGFGVTFRDPARARERLVAASRARAPGRRSLCCESRLLSSYFHEACDGWRELPADGRDARRDPQGLHLLLGDRPGNPLGDSIHIDPIAPYRFRREDGRCRPTLSAGALRHLRQVFTPRRPIESPFDACTRLLTALRAAEALPGRGGGDDRAELDAIARVHAEDERVQACLGREGWDRVQARVDRLRALARTTRVRSRARG